MLVALLLAGLIGVLVLEMPIHQVLAYAFLALAILGHSLVHRRHGGNGRIAGASRAGAEGEAPTEDLPDPRSPHAGCH